MTLTRRHRFVTVLFVLLSLLFMQLAVAGYVCPGRLAEKAEVTTRAAMTQADMPCADAMAMAMDREQPSLCRAHCGVDQQSADKYQVPAVVCLTDLATSFPLSPVTPALLGVQVQVSLLTRTTAPPLAVRHCCLRI